MKRTILLAVTAIVALMAASCQKDEGRILSATIEQYEHNNKAYIDNENYACWSNGDHVKINGTTERSITIGATGHSDQATIDVSGITGDITAFYPASRIEGTTVTFPYVQEYDVDDQGRQLIDNPMAAYCPAGSNELKFRNLGALLQVTLKPASTILVRAIEVKGVDNQMLCGKAQLTSTSNGQPMLEALTDGNSSVVLHFDTPQEVTSAGSKFYIVVPANTNFYNLTIAVLASENSTFSHHCKTSKIGEVLSRNNIGAITYTLDHNDNTFTPAWGISYTSIGNITITPNTEHWGVSVISNSNGKMMFDDLLTTIGDNAFKECSDLRSITLPLPVTSIGKYAFARCFLIRSISLPDNITSIAAGAFAECFNLESISLPSSLTTIGDSAFYSCDRLQGITLPNGLQALGASAFCYCTNLQDITLPNGLQALGEYAFKRCGLESITIPNGITEIKQSTFADCSALWSVVFPQSLSCIGDAAFENCERLTLIECYRTVPPTIGHTTFSIGHSPRTISVNIPAGTSSAYNGAWNCMGVTFNFHDVLL